MENDTQKLLIGIGQPEFSYRSFNIADAQAVVRKWPLVEQIARSAALRSSLGQGNDPRATGLGGPTRSVRPARAGFLKGYDPADPAHNGEPASADVRALLGRLSRDLL